MLIKQLHFFAHGRFLFHFAANFALLTNDHETKKHQISLLIENSPFNRLEIEKNIAYEVLDYNDVSLFNKSEIVTKFYS